MIYYNISVDTALLRTKLFIPQLRPPIVSRPLLIERLNAGLFSRELPGSDLLFDRKLTLISAPAGFGKTTLLAEWINGSRIQSPPKQARRYPRLTFAWLSLDERDNDLNRFLIYMIAAIQSVRPRIGRSTLQVILGPEPTVMEPVLTMLINEISQLRTGDEAGNQPLVLVFDDYHLIQAQPVHETIAYLLDNLPPQLHLVIATRVDPPLPLARLRGRGRSLKLQANDLRFSREQTAVFLNDIMDLVLPDRVVAALADYTEGWIAGLQMVAVALQGRELSGQSDFLDAGSREIGDYLFEEVLECQPPEVQRFLLRTSILERLCGPLCNAVTGESGGQAMLERIEKANLFISPLDAQQHWYRFHHLFAGLLQQYLERTDPEIITDLHRRASGWHEANGPPEAAIKHAIAAGENRKAANLIEGQLDQTLMRGEFITLLDWLDALPDSLLAASPRLCAYHALVLILGGRPLEQVEDKIKKATRADPAGLVTGEITLLKAILAVMAGDGQRGYELSMAALELLPEKDRFFQSLLFRNLATVYKLTGDVRAASLAIEEGARIAQTSGDHLSTIVAQHQMAEVSMLSGQLHEAHVLCQKALEAAVDQDGRPLLVGSKILVTLGELYREWNELDKAAAYLTQAIDLAGQWVELWAMSGHIILARVRQAQGKTGSARESMQIARQMAIAFDTSEVDDLFVSAYQARLWLSQANIEAAMRWAHERGLLASPGDEWPVKYTPLPQTPYYLREFELITLARLLLALDRPGQAKRVLDPLLEEAQKLGRTHSVIEIEALRALAQQALALRGPADFAEAVSTLRHALTLAEAGGYQRLFIELGPAMSELLNRIAHQGVASEYCQNLLSVMYGDRSWSQPVFPSKQPLIDPLSDRELEILRLLTTHLTGTEIATELSISANTVRFHTKNIYSKLGVHSRAEAVERAWALALL